MQTVVFAHPFREAAGVASTNAVSALYHVGLAGRGYFLDLKSDRLNIASLPVTREQTDDNDEAGPGSLASQDVWRKQARSWHEGAGQSNGDEADGSPFRFDTSKGVNVWERWELSLLPDTSRTRAAVDTIQTVVVAGGVVYHQAGIDVKQSADGVTWDTFCTLDLEPTSQMVTDGVDLYIANATNIAKVTADGTQTVGFTLAGANVLGFSKGRLWAGVGAELYWMTPAVAPTLVVSGPFGGDQWVWTAICDGRRATYAAGYAGDRSHVYRVPINDDGTGLDAAVQAWTAPDGELVHSLTSYLGYVVLGTSLGVRFSIVDDIGDLTPGSYIEAGPVLCLEPQDRFVWFGWSNYDNESTGLGRIDLSVFTGQLTPAYATDLMFTGQGDVTSVATFGELRLFTVAGAGVITEGTTTVGSGVLVGSEWSFGLDDDKLATAIDVSHRALDGSVQLGLQVNGSGAGVLAESSVQGSSGPSQPYAITPIRASRFAMEVTLNAGVGVGPQVTGWKLLARPLPPQTMRIVLPILLSEQHDAGSTKVNGDPFEEFLFLRQLWRSGVPVNLQWGSETFVVFPANFEWIPYRQMQNRKGWTGTCLMELREVAQ